MLTLKRWCLAIAASASMLAPLAANADPILNLPGSPNFNPPGNIALDFAGVTAETAAIDSGANGGSCSLAGGNGTCLETTYGAGVITDVYNNNTNANLWTGGVVSGSNPTGSALGFVIYGIADASVVSTTTVVGGTTTTTETVDNTGATATGGVIHIDVYSMPSADTACFNGTCGANNVTASEVAGVTSTANSDVFNSATLFAAFTLQPGVVPLNTAADGTSNGNVTLTQDVTITTNTTPIALTTVKGTGNFYASCAPSPGCSDFESVPELLLAIIGSGALPDPMYAALLSQIYGELNITGPTAGESADGWGLTIKDPVFAVDVPEPATLALLGSGLTFFGVAVRRRRRKGATA